MEVSLKIERRKKVIGKTGIIFLVIVLLLTFFSKTINNLLLPEVDCTSAYSGVLEKGVEAIGEVKHPDVAQVFSYGSWMVKDVKVKVNDVVKKGDILAVIDDSDAQLELKSSRLEVLKLENELAEYKENFTAADIASYEHEAEKAKRELERCRESLVNIRALYDQGAETYANVKECENNAEDAEENYQAKLKLVDDMKSESVKRKAEFERKVSQMTLEIELRKLQNKNLENKLPAKGEIKAPVDGTIGTVSIRKGENTIPGQVIFVVSKADGRTAIAWKLNDKKSESIQQGDEVQFTVKMPEEKEFQGTIEKKEYLAKEGMYEFTCSTDSGSDSLADGQQVNVKITKESKEYDAIIPNSCIIKDNSGQNFVYAVYNREGVLGEENYVQKVYLNVLESDDFNSAVNNPDEVTKNKVVSYSTKVLYDGVQVKIR